MQLSKRVPARTHTETFTQIGLNFAHFNDVWRRARASIKADPLDKCWWCKKGFAENEPIAIGLRPKGKNVVLCDQCAQEALRSAKS